MGPSEDRVRPFWKPAPVRALLSTRPYQILDLRPGTNGVDGGGLTVSICAAAAAAHVRSRRVHGLRIVVVHRVGDGVRGHGHLPLSTRAGGGGGRRRVEVVLRLVLAAEPGDLQRTRADTRAEGNEGGARVVSRTQMLQYKHALAP